MYTAWAAERTACTKCLFRMSFCLCWRSMNNTQDTNIQFKRMSRDESRHDILRSFVCAFQQIVIALQVTAVHDADSVRLSTTSMQTCAPNRPPSLAHWCNYNFVGVADVAAGTDSKYSTCRIFVTFFQLLLLLLRFLAINNIFLRFLGNNLYLPAVLLLLAVSVSVILAQSVRASHIFN